MTTAPARSSFSSMAGTKLLHTNLLLAADSHASALIRLASLALATT